MNLRRTTKGTFNDYRSLNIAKEQKKNIALETYDVSFYSYSFS
jgi:hypothetical protein